MSDLSIIRRGGGGANLNYKVVGGTSQPTSPKENTIWVNTSTAITSHVFSATEPTSPVPGMVWFQTSTASTAPINALKKNALWVYPTACKQYENSAWVAKVVEIYQNGWVPLESFIYKSGTQYYPFTDSNADQVTWGESSLYLDVPSAKTGGYVYTYTDAIDLSAFSELKLTYEGMLSNVYTGASGSSFLSLGVIADDTPTVEKSGIIANAVASATYKFPGGNATATYDGTLTLPVSDIAIGKIVVALGNDSKSSQVSRYSHGYITEIEMVV